MKIIGTTTITPALFYSGKLCGYITWVILLGYIMNIVPRSGIQREYLQLISAIFLAIGLIITIISLVNLGKSTRLGLPIESTTLKAAGIYRLSRNPMYFGFNLLTIASMLYCINVFLLVMGIYSIVVYHLIILGEERFLANRFGDAYTQYKLSVRRYI